MVVEWVAGCREDGGCGGRVEECLDCVSFFYFFIIIILLMGGIGQEWVFYQTEANETRRVAVDQYGRE
jgi:hypothetical protein